MLPDAGQHGKVHGRHRARRVLTGSLIVGATAPACLGLALTLGASVVPLVLIVAASSPHALSFYARWLRNDSTAASTTALAAWAPGCVLSDPGWSPAQRDPEPHRMSMEELCQAWCASYRVLLEQSSGPQPKAVLATVEERQSYLDELERRNATGLAAWLASGARVASNPLPYLVVNRTDPPAINWEELT